MELQANVRAYLQVLAVALAPSLLFRMYATLNQSLGKPLRVTALQIAALCIKIPLSIWFTLGGWGLEAQGLVRRAWATLVVTTVPMLMGINFLTSEALYAYYKIFTTLEAVHCPQIP